MKAQSKARAPRAPRAPKAVKQATKLLALPLLAPIDALNSEPLNGHQLINRQQAIALIGGLKTQPIVKSVKIGRQPTNYIGKTNQPVQNGIRHPKPETLCGKSWAICQQYYDTHGVIPLAKTIGDIALEQGIKRNTSQSEFSMWRIYHFGR
jgi:hypothetical protein